MITIVYKCDGMTDWEYTYRPSPRPRQFYRGVQDPTEVFGDSKARVHSCSDCNITLGELSFCVGKQGGCPRALSEDV